MKKILVAFASLLVFSQVLMLVAYPHTASADEASELKRRRLIYFRECLLERFDSDDEYDQLEDFFTESHGGGKENVVVGFDIDRGNGVQTCSTITLAGIEALNGITNNGRATEWFTQRITGQTFNSGNIGNNESRDKANRDALVGEINQALQGLNPDDSLTRKRLYDLLYTCYDLGSSKPPATQPRDGSHDFEHTVGETTIYATYKGDEVIDDSLSYLTRHSGVDNTNDELGSIDLDFGHAGFGTDFDFTKSFFPFGKDRPNLTSGAYNGGSVLSCQWARQNRQFILAATTGVQNGVISTPDGAIPPSAIVTQTDPLEDNSCENRSDAMGWIMCPVIKALQGALNWIDTQIQGLLEIDQNTYDNDRIQSAWASVRNIAYIILVPIMLIMVIGTALGFSFVDAYTVKRAMPRFAVAVIFIALSYEICVFLIQFFNALGYGTLGIITAPFRESVGDLTLESLLGGSVLTSMFAAPLWGVGVAIFLSFFWSTLLLIIAIAFLVLLLRQMFIVGLLLVAPLAILAWIFPGNDKLWKTWWGSFSKLLLMFPLIMGLIGLGRIFAFIIDSGEAAGLQGAIIKPILTTAAYVIPYAFIPFTFKLAGGMFATVTGMVNDRSKGIFDRQKQNRAAKWERGPGRRILQNRAAASRWLTDQAAKEGAGKVGRLGMRLAARGVGGYNVEAAMSARTGQVAKELQDQIATGKDGAVRGLTATYAYDAAKKDWASAEASGIARVENGRRQYKSLGGAWVDEGEVLEGKRRWGNDTFAQQAALSYEMKKSITDEQVEGLTSNYGAQVKSWGMSDQQAFGAWIGSGFENQNQHLEFKHTKWNGATGRVELNGAALATEMYERRGSYNLAQMSAHTIEQLSTVYDTADEPTKRKIEAVAETFMSRYGSGTAGGEDEELRAQQLAAAQGIDMGAAREQIRANTPGAAHVAEEVRKLTVKTGVYQKNPSPDPGSTGPFPPNPDQV